MPEETFFSFSENSITLEDDIDWESAETVSISGSSFILESDYLSQNQPTTSEVIIHGEDSITLLSQNIERGLSEEQLQAALAAIAFLQESLISGISLFQALCMGCATGACGAANAVTSAVSSLNSVTTSSFPGLGIPSFDGLNDSSNHPYFSPPNKNSGQKTTQHIFSDLHSDASTTNYSLIHSLFDIPWHFFDDYSSITISDLFQPTQETHSFELSCLIG